MQENLVEKLKRKELPNTNQCNGIRVRIYNPIPEEITGEEITGEEKEKVGVRIVNKTNETFDRELVLDRLLRHGVFTVVEHTKPPKISEPFLEENMNVPVIPIITTIRVEKVEEKEEEDEEEEEIKKEGEIEKEEEKEKVKKIPKRITKKKQPPILEKNELILDLSKVKIGREFIETRIPKRTDKTIVNPPPYYMNNRKLFLKKINELFKNYNKEIAEMSGKVSCKTQQNQDKFELLTHQKVVRDYLNVYSPYRGLLLYHGLGSGKTCTSIAIAEGIKFHKKVFIMTPASLKMNFFSELKKCGDPLYKKNQYWEFVSIEGQPDYPNILSQTLSLPIEYIQKKGGAWLVNIANKPNYTDLTSEEQVHLDEQLNYMIRSKYIDLNYNGMTREKLRVLTADYSKNPFDHSVIIIDEAHNFVSRIVNKLPKTIPKKKNVETKKTKVKSISVILYEYLMSAIDARIVLLTGTPIINYPKEIGVLYNILRGYIKSWTFSINVTTNTKINRDSIIEMLNKAGLRTFDYVEYSGNNLTITRNPFGFINAQKTGKTGGGQRITKKKHTKRIIIKRNTKKNHKRKDKYSDPLYTETNGIIRFKSQYNISDIDSDNYSPETKTDYYLPSHMQYTGENDPHYGGGEEMEEMNIKTSILSGGDGSEVFDNYNGIYLNEAGNISDTVFEQTVLKILSNNNLVMVGKPVIVYNKSLPDDGDTFNNIFVNSEVSNEKEPMKNEDLFKRRILGLTSYFRSAQESLLPSYELNKDGGFFHIISNEMSEYQFETYEVIRAKEAEMEKNNKKAMKKKTDAEDDTIASTYRIFSRAACNFAFPDPPGRPMPSSDTKFAMVEDAFKKNIDQEEDEEDQEVDIEEGGEEVVMEEEVDYNKRIQKAMMEINTPEFLSPEALRKYSPKFASVLQNLTDESHIGLHLLYTNFRTIEGVGILRLILLQNGFAEFKLHKDDRGAWDIDEGALDVNKPKFVLYTGTETAEEKEIVRNIYNSSWELVPASIIEKLNTLTANPTDKNLYGAIIKLIMITASGAEGINLKNTRYVHIIEPYWHMVRLEQVIGRARRICSHEDLPEELRTIKVFLYLSVLSADQRTNEKHIELQIRDISKIDNKSIVTTDETLFEMASKKNKINQQILRCVKESAIDCNLYSNGDLKCYSVGKVESNNFLSYPSLEKDANEKQEINIQKEKLLLTEVSIGKKKYHVNKKTMELYEHENVMKAKKTGEELISIGRLVKEGRGYKIIEN